ncbi:cation-transporting ATPase [Pseudoclavibacter sp. VKM Ac-2888]|uniref:cation-transporting ATPase n=1 Tax=Pseudoclavibacter sp. VKM Ac-2888 TaxID=2783830 RepID=UPI00188CAB03|nr:cation-transporting ATPase [Pseudoclavibacter sp. VKM Ac-2888]MBF4550764.1 cation-transporting ATPase [Pseudoclavibacter sp. VKM Ac-2888]
MVDFNKILGAASKALGNSGNSGGNRGGKSGSGDWKDMVRKVADQVTGDGQQPRGQQGYPARDAAQQRDQYQQSDQYTARDSRPRYGQQPPSAPSYGSRPASNPSSGSAADKAAIAKYDYLLKTAAPDQLEQAHREAFQRLTPEQRDQVRERLSAESGPYDRPQSSSPDDLARAATRGEVQRPGFMAKVLGAGKRIAGSRGGSNFTPGSSRGGSARFGRGAGVAGAAAAGVGAGALGGIALGVVGGAVASSVALPLIGDAMASGIDFDGIAASGIEGFEGLTADLGEFGGIGEAVSGLGDQASGFGDQLTGAGEQLTGAGDQFLGGVEEQAGNFGFDIPGLGDLFGK